MKYFIIIALDNSWIKQDNTDPYLFDWAEGFINKYYKEIGLADLVEDSTIYKWDNEVENYQPQGAGLVHILENKYK